MESKDIIKALECISGQASPGFDCGDCRIERSKYTTCEVFVTEHALELIKNQQAEIEKLKDILDKKVIEFAYEKKQEIKIEAYKEFAELSKERLTGWDTDPTDEEIEDTLDDVLQELTERKEDEE